MLIAWLHPSPAAAKQQSPASRTGRRPQESKERAGQELSRGVAQEKQAERELGGVGTYAERARQRRLRGQAHVDGEGGDGRERGERRNPGRAPRRQGREHTCAA